MTAFGTLRGRLGFTPVAPLLIYGTGGLAYGQVSSDLVVGQAFIGPWHTRFARVSRFAGDTQQLIDTRWMDGWRRSRIPARWPMVIEGGISLL